MALQNGAEWLERRIRVQYCESLEMKNKRRTQKYFSSLATGGNPYLPGPAAPYYASSFPYPVPMMVPSPLTHHRTRTRTTTLTLLRRWAECRSTWVGVEEL
jgi:hypothetical protein